MDTLKQIEQLTLLFLRDTQLTADAVQELQPFFSAEGRKIIHQSGKYPGTRKVAAGHGLGTVFPVVPSQVAK